jgi:hypothetical protein
MLVKKEKVEVQKSRSRDGDRDGDDGEDERSEQKKKEEDVATGGRKGKFTHVRHACKDCDLVIGRIPSGTTCSLLRKKAA